MRSLIIKVLLLTTVVHFFLSSSCTTEYSVKDAALENIANAGPNKEELNKVLDHFADDEKKLHAAYFLIANMKGHIYFEGHEKYYPAFDALEEALIPRLWKRKDTIINTWETSIQNIGDVDFNRTTDLITISSKYLIENIDIAFLAHNRIPESVRPSFDQFLEHTLPYRVNQEPLENGLRKSLYHQYSWAYDQMNEEDGYTNAICSIKDSVDAWVLARVSYSAYLPVSKLNESRVASCDNIVMLYVHIFRSLGIPCTTDFIPQWGNHHFSGHSWLVLFEGQGHKSLDIYNFSDVKPNFRYASLPKVYRKQFSESPENKFIRNFEDVTRLYKSPNEVELNIASNKDVFNLGVFTGGGKVRQVGISLPRRDKVTFKDLSPNIIYIATSPDKDLEVAFMLDSTNQISIFEPNLQKKIDANLKRKYAPFEIRNLQKIQWVRGVNGARILGANRSDYRDTVLIHNIELEGMGNNIFDTGNEQAFKYYILAPPPATNNIYIPMYLASFHTLDQEGKNLDSWKQTVIIHNKERTNSKKIFDNDPLTSIGNTTLHAIHHFKEKVVVKKFLVRPRNDDNNVKSGDVYELHYWDNEWKSLGQKTALTDSLSYPSVPSETIYWLRNLSRGKEEYAFLLDPNGEQIWPGISDELSDSEYKMFKTQYLYCE